MSVPSIDSLAQFHDIIKSGKGVVIYFWAPWSGPCRVIGPVFDQFAEAPEFAGNVELWKVNVDDQVEIATEAGASAIPAFVAYKDGKKTGNSVVGVNEGALKDLLESLL